MKQFFKNAPLGSIIAATLCLGTVASAGVMLSHSTRHVAPEQAKYSAPAATPAPRLSLSGVLTRSDAARYRYIFNAQKAGDWQAADAKLAEVNDPLLMGHVQAQRYASRAYKTTFAEASAWLGAYGDHPQAYDIYKLAVAKRAANDARLPVIARRPALSGYGDDNGLSRRSDDPLIQEAVFHLSNNNAQDAYRAAVHSTAQNAHWLAGLAAWRMKDTATAAAHFRVVADAETGLSAWEQAAGAYWAHRAYEARGNSAMAAKYLEIAASHPRTFYGVMARKALGRSLELSAATPPALSETALNNLYVYPGVKRAIALVQAGQNDLAEIELRTLFPTADRDTRVSLLSLATALDLPAAQISMAKALKKQGISYDTALYPLPSWQPTGGFVVDASLVFAFTRQESGFRADAKSEAGALGLMQLMPQTASRMQTQTAMALPTGGLFEPAANLALGQTYVAYLINNTAASRNLVFLAAAYNAGPGKLAEWTKSIDYHNDPLLFMESIPFAQTRNYVAQVLTSYWIYQEMQGKVAASALSLAEGKWPLYDAIPTAAQLTQEAPSS